MIDTWQKAVNYDEKASKNGEKATEKCWKSIKNGEITAKKRRKAAKMVRKAVRVALFLTVWGRCLTFSRCDEAAGASPEPFGCCQRNRWVPPKKPMGAAEETNGFLGRNRWFPPRHRRKPHVRRFKTDGQNMIWGRFCDHFIFYKKYNAESGQDRNLGWAPFLWSEVQGYYYPFDTQKNQGNLLQK